MINAPEEIDRAGAVSGERHRRNGDLPACSLGFKQRLLDVLDQNIRPHNRLLIGAQRRPGAELTTTCQGGDDRPTERCDRLAKSDTVGRSMSTSGVTISCLILLHRLILLLKNRAFTSAPLGANSPLRLSFMPAHGLVGPHRYHL
eukprot:SAG11_NODE_1096_length_5884_cov_4.310631_4_plen_145_part_00